MGCLTQIDFLKHLKSLGHFTFVCVASSFHPHSTFPSVCADQSSCLQNSNLILFTLCFKENRTSPGFTFSKQILARRRYHSYSGDKRFAEMGNGTDCQKKTVNVFLSEKKLILFTASFSLLLR